MNSNLTELQRNRLDALAEEFAERKRQGDSVSIDEYVRQHPELADDIRELFPVVAMLDNAGAEPIRQALPVKDECTEIGPGTRIGDYQLIRSIGQGGMGVVYQAKHIVLGSAVAIKLLPFAAGRPKLRERFQREATAAAKMHHPNIVRVFDFGSYGETLYYVMALVEGLGLNDILDPKAKPCGDSTLVDHQTLPSQELPNASHEPTVTRVFAAIEKLKNDRSNAPVEPNDPGGTQLALETKEINGKKDSGINLARLSSASSRQISLWNWVASVGRQASDAIDYAHSVGVIHRDIKPANLMIDADETIFVLDFGLAKLNDDQSLTATGDVMGTLRYMPPEAFSGRADHRSDIYSLGLTLYELLANRPAFGDVDRGKLISAVTHGQLRPLRQMIPKIPRDLEIIIHKSIATDPSDRYQSAGDFRDDLSRFLKGEPVNARRPSLLYKTGRWMGRNRAISSLAGCVLMMSLIAAAAFSISENRKQFANLQQQLATEKQQLADERKQSADRIANVFDRFLRGYDPSFKMRETITREDLLDEAAALLDTEFERDPLVEAKLRMTVGTAYLWDDQTDTVLKGEPHLKRAVDLLRKHDGEPLELARALTGLARTRHFGGLPTDANPLGFVTDLEATKQLLEEAIEIHRRIDRPGLYWAETIEVLALAEIPWGADESKRLIRQGLAMLEGDQSYEAIRTRALLYGNQGRAEAMAGNWEQAELSFRNATELSEELDNFLVGFHAYDLGNAQIYRGKFAEGEATFKKYLDTDPHVFWPRVTMAIAAQGDWQRAIEWAGKSTSALDQDSWQGFQSRRIESQYLRLSGDDETAIQVLGEVVQKMEAIFDPGSPQQKMEYMQANYYLARMMLFSENEQFRPTGISILEAIRDKLDPIDSPSTGTVRSGYAIGISLLPEIANEDMALAERCIELMEQDRAKDQPWNYYDLELLLAKSLVNEAKSDRSVAVSNLKKIIDISNGQDHYVARSKYREPVVWRPTLRIAEELLVRWLREDGKPDEAVTIMRDAVKRRKGIKHPSRHLINFANARLGRLLLKLDRKEEAREVLSELAATTKDGPECFKWLEKRVAADLKLTEGSN